MEKQALLASLAALALLSAGALLMRSGVGDVAAKRAYEGGASASKAAGGAVTALFARGARSGAADEWALTATCADPAVTPPTPSCGPIADRGKGHVLVTGGAGFIGSHTVLALLRAGYAVTVMDNLINSSPESVARVAELAGVGPSRLQFVLMDLRDAAGLKRLMDTCGPFDAVIHFAGLKAVGESVQRPLAYYENNVQGTVALLQAMASAGVTRIVFSSSATVYGSASKPPLREDALTGQGITNPYGQTKYVIERILRDVVGGRLGENSLPWQVVSLRYFNPIGADPSGKIGEHPSGTPNNVMPYITQVASGARPHLTVFGTDYPTADGTGERDYVHVADLADGHVAALRHMGSFGIEPRAEHFNLGAGNATSVLALVGAFRRACSCDVPVVNGTRRAGDIAALFADPSRANRLLGWKATRSIADACADTWRFATDNLKGFTRCTVERTNGGG